VLFGIAADQWGRVRALSISILTYSFCTAMLATSTNVTELVIWRTLVGFGLGGEWAAGSTLVAEVWPAHSRGRAIGWMQSGWAIGYLLAAGLATLILPRFGWRVLFACGALPALFVFWIRRNLVEHETMPAAAISPWRLVGTLFSPGHREKTALATLLATLVLFAYWGLFTWVPAFLATPVEQGGAGLDVLRSSGWVIWMQVGSFFGYTSFGYFSDAYGRRPTFLVYVVAAAIVVGLYARLASSPFGLIFLGPAVGFFGHGYFSVFGALLSEIFPGHLRATALAFCYNTGKALSAFAPLAIGYIADQAGVGQALGLTGAFFLASAVVIWLLPETRGKELAAE
jgi:MFS family permease